MRKKAARRVPGRGGSTPRKPGSKVALAAHSAKTGLMHVFGDVAKAQLLANQFKRARKAKLETELVNSIAFWHWIQGLPAIVTVPSITWNQPVYRTTDGWSPLSVVGSIADGGRFNVGGAQLCPELPDVKKVGALYVASSLACCYREMSGNPIGRPDEYELTPTRNFQLWDLTQVITELNRPGLEDLVKAAPFEAIWGYQKVPLIPQLLAYYLRRIGGDGVAFPSTKEPSALNLCFFFRTDDEVRAGFTARKLN